MPVSITFDGVRPDYVQFSVDADSLSFGVLFLRASGQLVSSESPVTQPIEVNGWEGISDDTRIMVERVIIGAMMERVALLLELSPGQGLLFDRLSNVIRETRQGEEAQYVVPMTPPPSTQPAGGEMIADTPEMGTELPPNAIVSSGPPTRSALRRQY